MKHIVSLSGGLGSFWAAKRVVEKHGAQDVVLLFADVLMEDEDLYRFNNDIQVHLGIEITAISEGRTPWQVFEDEGFMGNTRVDFCSRILKRDFLFRWIKTNFKPKEVREYIGIDWTEIHRLDTVRERRLDWVVHAPMCAPPYWNKCKMVEECRKLGIEPPRMYDHGFPHNNCGGFCVKAGQTQFAKLLEIFPERYAYHEQKEREFRAKHGDYSILRDRRGGKTKTLTLEQLRKRIEAGEKIQRGDWGGCGCAL